MGKVVKAVSRVFGLGGPDKSAADNAAREAKRQAELAEKQLKFQQEQAAAANADLTLGNIANVQTGGTADVLESGPTKKKKTGVGGPVSTSLGINV